MTLTVSRFSLWQNQEGEASWFAGVIHDEDVPVELLAYANVARGGKGYHDAHVID